MIAFRDFLPRQSAPVGIDRALVEANEWLVRTGIQPLNIETLRNVSGTMTVHASEAGIRVWYLVAGTTAAS